MRGELFRQRRIRPLADFPPKYFFARTKKWTTTGHANGQVELKSFKKILLTFNLQFFLLPFDFLISPTV
jgi:hypothetical protein